MRQLIAGNWKMNGTLESARKLTKELVKALSSQPHKADILLCPSSLHVGLVAGIAMGTGIFVGAQDCSAHPPGAHTGDLAAEQIADMGCQYVILGHSERRQEHQETSGLIAGKAGAAHRAGLKVILCVGETDAQRSAGQADQVVAQQLEDSLPSSANFNNTVVAYEPVWAIGTGKTASPADIEAMHSLIRTKIAGKLAHAENMRILYGGSVKVDNAREILHTKGVNGALVGGASLKADEFLSIINAV